MLVIREEQMNKMSEAIFHDFVVKTREKLKVEFSEGLEALDNDALENLICKSIKLAAEYGVDRELDVEKFIEYVARYGLEFDKNNLWAQKILSDENMDGTDKMIELEIQEPR